MKVDERIDQGVARQDWDALRATYRRQGGVVVIDDFLPPALVADSVAEIERLRPNVHRNHVPGQKQGGSISRHTLDREGSGLGDIYRSESLREMLDSISGDALLDCLARDPHSYALYFYNRPGDYIGWHYDTSFYRGKRYTVLLGLIENESCQLDCELHTKDESRENERMSIRIRPGTAVFFDGDALWHRVTPLAQGDGERVVLTLEFVTDPTMNPFRRLVSDIKDAVAYFGWRDVFLGGRGPQPG